MARKKWNKNNLPSGYPDSVQPQWWLVEATNADADYKDDSSLAICFSCFANLGHQAASFANPETMLKKMQKPVNIIIWKMGEKDWKDLELIDSFLQALLAFVFAAAALPAVYSAPAAKSYAQDYGYTFNPLGSSVAPSSQYHAQDANGQYSYGYAGPNSAKQEFKTADGVVRGAYSYVDANGIIQSVNYISDILGFRASGTNIPHVDQPAPVAYSEATINAVPVQQVVSTYEAPEYTALAPTVQYSFLPYAPNYRYYFNWGQPSPVIPHTAPVIVQSAAPVVNEIPVIAEANGRIAYPVESAPLQVPETYAVDEHIPEVAQTQYHKEPVFVQQQIPVVTQSQYHAQESSNSPILSIIFS
jgi:hypothetical protein